MLPKRAHETRSVSLPSSAQAPAAVRAFLRCALETWAVHRCDQAVELCASELVSNVVYHVGSPMTVRVTRVDAAVQVEVDDDSTQAPVLRYSDASQTSGRGLRIVDSLASEWGTHMGKNGKTVWFVVTPH